MTQEISLHELAKKARSMIIDMAATPTGCHIGGSLSVVEILISTYTVFGNLANSTIVLSKGHAAAALYAVLYLFGFLPENPTPLYGKKGSIFTGHPSDKIPGVKFSTGSLGHGIPYALGVAMANPIQHREGVGLVITGDGELQEGLCWEAFQIAQAKNVNNFVVIVDRNGGQNDGKVDEISPLRGLKERFLAFQFDVQEVDGHNLESLLQILTGYHKKPLGRLAILANTVKSKGVAEIEGNPASHYMLLKQSQAEAWKRSIQ